MLTNDLSLPGLIVMFADGKNQATMRRSGSSSPIDHIPSFAQVYIADQRFVVVVYKTNCHGSTLG
jgi:hypothetical protein